MFTYYLVAVFDDGTESTSNFSTVTAENDAPVANPDPTVPLDPAYTIKQGTLLTVPARGVLTNDTDTDSPLLSLTAVLVTGPPAATTVQFQLNADGSFTYQVDERLQGARDLHLRREGRHAAVGQKYPDDGDDQRR